MTDSTSDGHIDRLVKEGWLRIGLSQSDLAEVLDAALRQSPKQDGAGRNDIDRLMQIGQALDMSIDVLRHQDEKTETEPLVTSVLPADLPHSVLSLLELRLLRAFCQLRDYRTRRLLIELAEQIVKRQAQCSGDPDQR
jgi:transcriptional regulator with XRE-family HTH domain